MGSKRKDPELIDQYVVVTPEDYILGMSDLTGELMRYATNGRSSCWASDVLLWTRRKLIMQL